MDYSRLGPLGRYVDRERKLDFPPLSLPQIGRELARLNSRTQEILITHLYDFYVDCFKRDPENSSAPEMSSVRELCENIVREVGQEVSLPSGSSIGPVWHDSANTSHTLADESQ
jgi:hypothetical protein